MSEYRDMAVKCREDLSNFLYHFTRDDSRDESEGFKRVITNFRDILIDKSIEAYRPHCLHGSQIRKLPPAKQKQFSVCCFSEAPFSQIQNLLMPLPERKIKLRPYGLAFSQDFIKQFDSNPVIYLNDYQGSKLRNAANKLFEIGKGNNFTGQSWPLLPFMNTMGSWCDFAWEREWRVVGGVEFTYEDIEFVVMPEVEARQERGIRTFIKELGLPILCPEWSTDHCMKVLLDHARQIRKSKTKVKFLRPLNR